MKGRTDAVTQDSSRRLVLRKDEPIRVLQLRNHTVTVDVYDIHNVVSIDRITLAKTAEEAMQATGVESYDHVQLEGGNTGDGYVVKRNVRHRDDHKESKYLLRRYDNRPADDT